MGEVEVIGLTLNTVDAFNESKSVDDERDEIFKAGTQFGSGFLLLWDDDTSDNAEDCSVGDLFEDEKSDSSFSNFFIFPERRLRPARRDLPGGYCLPVNKLSPGKMVAPFRELEVSDVCLSTALLLLILLVVMVAVVVVVLVTVVMGEVDDLDLDFGDRSFEGDNFGDELDFFDEPG